MKLNRLQRSAALALAGVILSSIALVLFAVKSKPLDAITLTVGDIHVMHTQVSLSGHEVRGHSRLAEGDQLTTTPEGRATVRLDDGAVLVVDASTRLTLSRSGLTLNEGRLFVQGTAASRTEVTVGQSSAVVSSSTVAFDARPSNGGKVRIYCAQGELVLSHSGRSTRVPSGETASIDRDQIEVAPEKAFDDWTGGLAVPWAQEKGSRSAIAEPWGGHGGDDPGSPLVIRSQMVETTLDGELAHTKTRTLFFNGTDNSVAADIRMSLPPGAIVSRVSLGDGRSPSSDHEGVLLPAKMESQGICPTAQLNWAGDSWLRGSVPVVPAGSTSELVVEYVEWLSTQLGVTTYRYPMAEAEASPLIGELSASVDASRTGATWLRASRGSLVHGRTVELHRADMRPSGDLVVEYAPSIVKTGKARAYVEPGEKGQDPYVLFRTEVPEQANVGLALAIVLDTSMSAGVAGLESERAIVDALLDGLSPRDKVIVFAADQSVRPVGATKPASVTPTLRTDLRRALGSLRAGGASNLALALEQAADSLDMADSSGSSSMVIYLGDGRPTVSELDAQAIRARLNRRAAGMPRLSAVAVGESANRWLLARLVAGSGSIYEVTERSDAARVGGALVADALEPTVRSVDFDLGPNVDRIYPREARVALSGATVSVVGRLRGPLPKTLTFRFREGANIISQQREVQTVTLPVAADVSRRWAAARIEETTARGDGYEAARALAAQSKLLTPWTSWFFLSPGDTGEHTSPAFAQRLLGLSPALDAAFAPYIEPVVPIPSQLLEPALASSGGVTVAEGAQAAARRIIGEAMPSFKACRDARMAVRPNIAGSLRIALTLGPKGKATDVRVTAKKSNDDDPVLNRCVRRVIESLEFVSANGPTSLAHELRIPLGQSQKRTHCSTASALPLAVRRGIWHARRVHSAEEYLQAAHACELPMWRDRRALLEICLGPTNTSIDLEAFGAALEAAGESDAARFVLNEALRRATNPDLFRRVTAAALQGEPEIDGVFDRAFRGAKTDEQRLDVIHRYLRMAPHNTLARRRLLAVLESLNRKDLLQAAIEQFRNDPFVDAGLLAASASALRRIGYDAEGRRVFGELVERAPGDPWALAFAGDCLRAEELFDDAVAHYDSLARALPGDSSAILRLALAHAGAGRLDVATRLLERVTQNGGRGDDGRLGELASITQAVLLAAAREPKVAPDLDAQLVRRLIQTPLPDVRSLLLVMMPPEQTAVRVTVLRDRDEQPPDFDAPTLGLAAIRFERGAGSVKLRLVKPAEPGSTRPSPIKIFAFSPAEDRAKSKLVTRRIDIAPTGTPTEVLWNGESLI